MGAKSCIWTALLFCITRNASFIINTGSISIWLLSWSDQVKASRLVTAGQKHAVDSDTEEDHVT